MENVLNIENFESAVSSEKPVIVYVHFMKMEDDEKVLFDYIEKLASENNLTLYVLDSWMNAKIMFEHKMWDTRAFYIYQNGKILDKSLSYEENKEEIKEIIEKYKS